MERACSTIAGRATEGDDAMQKTANFACALLFGLLIAAAFGGRSAAAQGFDPGKEVATFFGLSLFGSLFSPPPATEEEQLRGAAADYSRAQAAYSQGPSESGNAQISFETHRSSLENLAKNARSPRVRRVARKYLSRLPRHFVARKGSQKRHRVTVHQPAAPRIRNGRYPDSDDASANGGGE